MEGNLSNLVSIAGSSLALSRSEFRGGGEKGMKREKQNKRGGNWKKRGRDAQNTKGRACDCRDRVYFRP